MIRKATEKDIDAIEAIYDAIHTEEEAGRMSTGWKRGVYPIRQTAVDALQRQDLFVEEQGGRIVASGIINQSQMPAYADCPWAYPAEDQDVMVLHTLVVHPAAGGHGFATELVQYYERYAREQGCHYLRIDTQERNAVARKMYKKMGFTEPGVVPCVFNGIPGVRLVCLEKPL